MKNVILDGCNCSCESVQATIGNTLLPDNVTKVLTIALVVLIIILVIVGLAIGLMKLKGKYRKGNLESRK